MQYLCILVPNWLDLLALSTVDSGYQANPPITLSGKNIHLIRCICLINRFPSTWQCCSSQYSSICTYWLWNYVTMHALYSFSITRPLNARLLRHTWAQPESRMVLKSQVQGSNFVLLIKTVLWHSLLTLISTTESRYLHLNYLLTTRVTMNIMIKSLLS